MIQSSCKSFSKFKICLFKRTFSSHTAKWNVHTSSKALQTVNPIRSTIESMSPKVNPQKSAISLAMGEPIGSHFQVNVKMIEAMSRVLKSGAFNGYQSSVGNEVARKAIAQYCGRSGEMNVSAQDVIITSGCSQALDLAMSVLAKPNCNMLIPRPGFPLYKTLSTLLDIQVRQYDLLPEKDWQINLGNLISQIDTKTCAIIYNNPSNPCGSVYSKEHIHDLLEIASKFKIPIIADEIYENMVFPDRGQFCPISSLSADVPILQCSGITKRFLVPGWRLGWIVIHDKKGAFGVNIRIGLTNLSQRILGSNTLVQGALPDILTETPLTYFNDALLYIHENANLAFEKLNKISGMHPIAPDGAFYMMVQVDLNRFTSFGNTIDFVDRLCREESVICLPGECFDYPGYVRLVLAIEQKVLLDAIERIGAFCSRNYEVN